MEAGMAIYFDKYAARGAYHWRETSPFQYIYNAPLVSRYKSVLKRIPPEAKEILDVGCGDGYFACLIAKAFPKSAVTGLDADVSGIEIARQRALSISNVGFEFSDKTALPFEDQRFDVIIMADVIEHLTNVKGMVSELRRILIPSGLMIITTPNRQIGSKWDDRHVFEFNGEELRTEIASQFHDVEVYGSWPMHHIRAWRRKRLRRLLLDLTARLGWNVFDREVRDPDASYGQLLLAARGPKA